MHFAGFDHDSRCSSSPAVLMDGFQQPFAGSGNFRGNLSALERKSHSDLLPDLLSSLGDSSIANEIAHMVQGRAVAYPVRQQLCIGDESTVHGLASDFSSLGFNELAHWGDIGRYAQEMATSSVLPPLKHEWVQGSTSCNPSGDVMTTTACVEFERPLGQPGGQHNYTIPTCAGMSTAGEGNELERRRPFQRGQSRHSTQSVATSVTSEDLYRRSYHISSGASSADAVLSFNSSSKGQTPGDATMFAHLQQCSTSNSKYYSQTLTADRHQDSGIVDSAMNTVDGFKVLGTLQQNRVQQEVCQLSMSIYPDLHGENQHRECRIPGNNHQCISKNLNYLKLKQKALAKPVPRAYQRRRIGMKQNEVYGLSTPLDHVQRERQRRDIMSSKVAALELLLPKGYKRDKVTIVYDAIQLVERLQRDVKDLQQRFHEAKLHRACHKQSRDPGKLWAPKSIDYNIQDTNGSYVPNKIVLKRAGNYLKPVAIRTPNPINRGTSGISRPAYISSMTHFSGGTSSVVDKGFVSVEFRVHLDDNVSVQEEKIWKCRCRLDYLTSIIVVVEEFQLDLTSCNIMKLSGYFICSMVLQARPTAGPISAAQFAARLQSTIDVSREAVKT